VLVEHIIAHSDVLFGLQLLWFPCQSNVSNDLLHNVARHQHSYFNIIVYYQEENYRYLAEVNEYRGIN
jgi:hypothetical protein